MLDRFFEGAPTLQALLAAAGSTVSVEEVVQRMREAQAEGGDPRDVVPGLFEGEPRFPDPGLARALYGNLLGLWDLLETGLPLEAEGRGPSSPAARPEKRRTDPPPPFGEAGPDEGFVQQAWRFLEDSPRERERRWHAFENRQDALLGGLDALELPDAADAVARQLLFELHAFLELGWNARARRVGPVDLRAAPDLDALPEPLLHHVDSSVAEAEADDEAPLTAELAGTVRRIALSALDALWRAGPEAG
jgi:pyruvate/2-oxoglutarate dehydrogenase complex dihydrolipoamide acyltransferase (E2) component